MTKRPATNAPKSPAANAPKRPAGKVTLRIEEPTRPPALDLALAFGATLPVLAGAVAVFAAKPQLAFLAQNLALLWGAAIVLFLSGVRRGVSFRTPGGPTAAQLAATFWLFALGLAALVAIIWGFPFAAALIEIIGYGSLAILDPIAARREEVPNTFARFRPIQMAIPILSLAAIAARAQGFL